MNGYPPPRQARQPKRKSYFKKYRAARQSKPAKVRGDK